MLRCDGCSRPFHGLDNMLRLTVAASRDRKLAVPGCWCADCSRGVIGTRVRIWALFAHFADQRDVGFEARIEGDRLHLHARAYRRELGRVLSISQEIDTVEPFAYDHVASTFAELLDRRAVA